MKKLFCSLNKKVNSLLRKKNHKNIIERKSITMLVPDDRIDRRVLLEARSLIRNGWSVTVIAAFPPYEGYREDEDCFPEVKIVRIDGNKACNISVNLKNKYDILNKDWKSFYWYSNHFYEEAMKHPASIYVAHDLPVLPAAIMAAVQNNAYIVYDSHELYPEQKHFGEERTKLYTDIESSLITLVDKTITVNKSIADELSNRYSIEIPEIILNCPDINKEESPSNNSDILRKKLNIPKEKRILLFQGSLSLNRNLENLVEAMSLVKNKDVVLVVLGPGDEKREELMAIAKEKNILNSKVFFHKSVPQSELINYTASADVGIIPYPHIDLNSYYCTPNKLFEFIVSGIPIVANYSPELIRFVGNQSIGFNSYMRNCKEIADAIDNIFQLNLDEFKRNVVNLRKNFTWEVEGEKVVKIYNSLIEKEPKVNRFKNTNG